MSWTCEQIEERLSDYVDLALTRGDRAEFEIHAAGCARCAPLVRQVSGVLQRVHALPQLEPPDRMVTAILEQTIGSPTRGWRRILGWASVLLQPRVAMGFATAAACLVILFYASGLNPTKLRKADLTPANIYRAANRQSHLVYARGVKYVNDLRVVYEIQSRLRAPEPPAQETRPQEPPANAPQQKSQDSPRPGRSSTRSSTLYAFVVAQAFARSSQ